MIAFDLFGDEVTRSLVTIENMDSVLFQATDAGVAVAERGGGSVSAYDGDSGKLMWAGPTRPTDAAITIDSDGPEITEAVRACLEPDDDWDWEIVGVFRPDDAPRDEDDEPNQWWDFFCYTVGMPFASVWAPWASIEGRGASPELIGMVLNRITAGLVMGVLLPGDSMRMPLGVAGREDDDDLVSVWWIGDPVIDAENRYQTNMERDTPLVIPVRWSSPLGFEHVTKTGKVLTEQELATWVTEAEGGYDIRKLRARE